MMTTGGLAGLAMLGWAGLRRIALFRDDDCWPGWAGWAGLAFAVELYFVMMTAGLAGLSSAGLRRRALFRGGASLLNKLQQQLNPNTSCMR